MKINNIITPETSILSALKLMDEIKRKLLIIIDGEVFSGVLSIGDIQRAIINQVPNDAPVKRITRTIITVAGVNETDEEIRAKMIALRTECMPVVDEHNVLHRVVFWEDLFPSKVSKPQLSVPVVIMAGGQGSRLKPLTNVIPKPLIPIGNKTFLEEIMDSFTEYGCHEFHISVNYKAEMIRYYLENESVNKYNVTYIEENEPLGTAGSLHLLKMEVDSTFFVSNCDIIVDQDYSEILAYHRENNNELTIVSAIKSFSIPYGTLETKENGLLKSITEKPDVTFQINTGLYILEPHLVKEIPKGKFYHITSLIEDLRSQNRRVGVFPVSEKSWRDIGEWKEYIKQISA